MTDNTNTPGSTAFTAQTTMLEALTADPSLGMVLMRDFHLGGCSHCGFDPHDTIANVAAQNGIPTERLLAALNRQAS
ncbi:MAG: disulfide oxidoreductase [Planctomycetes bacterium]|nr:disulfide oxidoreductase [Planctomycetota bacterium]MCB9886257.1 disulfide oxidoreductase [Planctomycetota bacterium]